MPKSHDFTAAGEGWSLVGHFIGNRLLSIRLTIEAGKPGRENEAASRQRELSERLGEIAHRMAEIGETAASEAVQQMKELVDNATLDSLEAVNTLQSQLDLIRQN